jgi:aryl-alcohol dehydrogenase-like predicted oxidoreductase
MNSENEQYKQQDVSSTVPIPDAPGSIIGLGGYHLGKQADPQESIRIIRTGLDEGLNFIDNYRDRNGGESEMRMGKALRDRCGQKAFLMPKIDGRNKSTAARQIRMEAALDARHQELYTKYRRR